MKSLRNLFFWLHLFVGCVAGVVILAMSITGALLAFERQIKAQVDAPSVLQGKADTTQKLSVDTVLSALKSDGQGIPTELVLHSQAGSPVEVRYGRNKVLFLNPWTAEIVGQPSEGTAHFFSAVERIHRSIGLGMQSRFGRGMAGAANLGFLFLLLTGAYLWLPRVINRASLRNRLLFRSNLSGKAREWNWHNVIGAWTLAPLLILVATGVIISYPWASNLLYAATGAKPPPGGARRGPRRNQPTTGVSKETALQTPYHTLEEAAVVVEARIPPWKSISIQVPETQDKTVDISVDSSLGGEPEYVTEFTLDRTSGTVQTVKRFSDNNAGIKLRAWSRFLHTGEEFGWPGQTVAMLACLGGVMLVWTGLSMAIRRAFNALSHPAARLVSTSPALRCTTDIRTEE